MARIKRLAVQYSLKIRPYFFIGKNSPHQSLACWPRNTHQSLSVTPTKPFIDIPSALNDLIRVKRSPVTYILSKL
jgi:hypothetical protein